MFSNAPKYSEEMVKPMREELTSLGVQELLSAQEVQQAITAEEGTALLIINSVCGCAAGNARPAVRLALQNEVLPRRVVTVFAGVDMEAVTEARKHIPGYPPSSPSMALFKGKRLVFMLPRHRIEGRSPQEIATDLKNAFATHCS